MSNVQLINELVSYQEVLQQLIDSAPEPSFTTHEVRTKSGKLRQVTSCQGELRDWFDDVLACLTKLLPVHPSATSMKGSSVVDNARRHVGARVLIKVDGYNFFESLRFAQIAAVLSAAGVPDAERLATYCCAGTDHLVQGLPTSPLLANAVAYLFDDKWAMWAVHAGWVYSRYVDDIALSCRNEGRSVTRAEAHVRAEQLSASFAALLGVEENRDKRSVVLRGDGKPMLVTGLHIDETLRAPRNFWRRLRTLLNLKRLGRLDAPDLEQLSGLKSFLRQIDRGRVDRLAGLYS